MWKSGAGGRAAEAGGKRVGGTDRNKLHVIAISRAMLHLQRVRVVHVCFFSRLINPGLYSGYMTFHPPISPPSLAPYVGLSHIKSFV